ncbi:DUF402 domain-containing protein [Corynebacterium sp. ES2730-CONJ]|uniref:DUF402 domain-containing protein n=1 Tax=Corynebacterium sp. ES2730-CONJ TaxID=2973941 RepID=UPI00216B3802|nr:DUF402 domain-containing protein [Corynebacterium sp. ES2730-CONJ]MCS4531846.1 DUF402 domain-containing protein [Corynebacterium sp. ES2730-CONJ]
MVDLHPIKEEVFDLESKINIDPKGFSRAVDSYRTTPCGLYMARGADHPQFGYLESWLLPKIGLRANKFHYRDSVKKREDIYIDVVDIDIKADTWTTRDLYVDLMWIRGNSIEVLDIDELAAATSAGLISADDAEMAIESTLRAVEGITRYGDDPTRWMYSQGIDIQWAKAVTLSPAANS